MNLRNVGIVAAGMLIVAAVVFPAPASAAFLVLAGTVDGLEIPGCPNFGASATVKAKVTVNGDTIVNEERTVVVDQQIQFHGFNGGFRWVFEVGRGCASPPVVFSAPFFDANVGGCMDATSPPGAKLCLGPTGFLTADTTTFDLYMGGVWQNKTATYAGL